MRGSAGGGAGRARNVADWRAAGRSRKLFGPRRNFAESAPALVREECADSWRGRGRAGGVRAEHAADGAVHEALSAARVCNASFRFTRCTRSDAEIDGSGVHEGGDGAVELNARALSKRG